MDFSVIQTALDDLKKASEDAVRRLRRDNGQLRQSIALDDAPPGALVPSKVHESCITTPMERETPAQVTLRVAASEWNDGVCEPGTPGEIGSAGRIDEYIRGPLGLGWNTCDIVHWVPGIPYTKNGSYFWCGAFAAFCWGHAGLKASIRKKSLAGTPRLLAWARNTERYIDAWQHLQPGDIMVVDPKGQMPGAHITLVVRVDVPNGIIHTIEGNAVGVAPSSTTHRRAGKWEGVVRNERHPAGFVFGVRPLAEDLATA